MAGEKILGQLLTDIQVVLDALNTYTADLTHLETRKTTLQNLNDEIIALNQQQESLKAQLKGITDQLKGKMKDAKKELKFIRKGVEATYGEDKAKLEAFGIKK